MKFVTNIKNGLKNGLKISTKIIVYMLPFYVIVDILEQSGYLTKISIIFKPIMEILGLPSEAAVAIISGMLINLYPAIAAMAPLSLSVKEITIVGLFLGIAHNLVIETTILSRSGVKAYSVVILRIATACIAAMGVNLLWT